MKGMILAAGYGTRLRPLTWLLPKPMVPLCNRPLIGWAVEAFLSSGVHEIIVNLHHLPEPIERYLTRQYGERASFHFSREEEILGTGGGVRRVRPHLEQDEAFFLVNADTVQFPRWAELTETLRESGSLAALTLRHPPEGDRFTAVWFDADTRLVTGFGSGSGEPLMFAGSHAISSRVFSWLPDTEFSGIVEHVYQPVLRERRETIGGVVDDGLWFDIGTPQRYIGASDALRLEVLAKGIEPPAGTRVAGDSLVHESATIEGSVTASVVGMRTRVGGSVAGSVIWDDCTIGPDVTLERCVVTHGVTLNDPLLLRDAIICPDVPQVPQEYARSGGLVVVPWAGTGAPRI
jgi:NDP-sugar pyrophosphorylase family protein